MLAAALLTVISFHNLFVGTMLCFLVSAAPAGLLAISLAVSAAGSMVIVNTVVLVKARFGLGEIEVAWGGGGGSPSFANARRSGQTPSFADRGRSAPDLAERIGLFSAMAAHRAVLPRRCNASATNTGMAK